VTMITGDHRITAAAIAKMLGIGDGKTAVIGLRSKKWTQPPYRSVSGMWMSSHGPAQNTSCVLVKAIQANGQIVAMTGDGVK